VGGLVPGDKIDHVTTYALAEHNDATLPSVVDQAKSFSYAVGTPAATQHFPDGYIQVALDSSFTSPVLATLNAQTNTWTAAIPGAPSAGTVYARQVLAKDLYTALWDDVQAGPVAQRAFGPTAVTVRSFVAHRSGGVVTLRWRTGSELHTLGYDLYRNGTRLNARLIPSTGSAAGHSYVWRDARPGRNPRYRLVEVRRDGSRRSIGLRKAG
jgi:hypothetical protein